MKIVPTSFMLIRPDPLPETSGGEPEIVAYGVAIGGPSWHDPITHANVSLTGKRVLYRTELVRFIRGDLETTPTEVEVAIDGVPHVFVEPADVLGYVEEEPALTVVPPPTPFNGQPEVGGPRF